MNQAEGGGRRRPFRPLEVHLDLSWKRLTWSRVTVNHWVQIEENNMVQLEENWGCSSGDFLALAMMGLYGTSKPSKTQCDSKWIEFGDDGALEEDHFTCASHHPLVRRLQ